MLIPVLLFIVGLLCLIKGGDWFVDGATGIARRFHVPELLIGATVVSIGTTLPEVMVSTTSALTGHGEIAYGNAIGSVICNSALIAAIPIVAKPGKVDPKSLRTPVLFFFVAAAFYAGVAYTTGSFTRPVGIILLAMFVAYIVCNVMAMKNASAPEEEEEPEENASFAKELGLLAEKFQLGQGAGGLPLAEGLGGGPNGGLNGLLPGLWCGKGVKGGTFHQGASFLRNCARSSLALRIRYLTKGRPMPRILAISRCLRSWRKKSTAAG